jgi:hypothetical protein
MGPLITWMGAGMNDMPVVSSLMIAIIELAGAVMSVTNVVITWMGAGMSDMPAFMSVMHAPMIQTNAVIQWMTRPDSLIDGLVSFNRPVIHGTNPVNQQESTPMSPNAARTPASSPRQPQPSPTETNAQSPGRGGTGPTAPQARRDRIGAEQRDGVDGDPCEGREEGSPSRGEHPSRRVGRAVTRSGERTNASGVRLQRSPNARDPHGRLRRSGRPIDRRLGNERRGRNVQLPAERRRSGDEHIPVAVAPKSLDATL